MKTAQGHEVDFLATAANGSMQLIQVSADLSKPDTFEREVRSLLGAAAEFPQPKKILITESQPPRGQAIQNDVELVPAWRWLLHPL